MSFKVEYEGIPVSTLEYRDTQLRMTYNDQTSVATIVASLFINLSDVRLKF